jgi:hypothetical protein
MTTRSLPERPDLDQLRRLAKELRNAGRAGDPEALTRLAMHHRPGAPVTLAAAHRGPRVWVRRLGPSSRPRSRNG